jgi:hypothetical protein
VVREGCEGSIRRTDHHDTIHLHPRMRVETTVLVASYTDSHDRFREPRSTQENTRRERAREARRRGDEPAHPIHCRADATRETGLGGGTRGGGKGHTLRGGEHGWGSDHPERQARREHERECADMKGDRPDSR